MDVLSVCLRKFFLPLVVWKIIGRKDHLSACFYLPKGDILIWTTTQKKAKYSYILANNSWTPKVNDILVIWLQGSHIFLVNTLEWEFFVWCCSLQECFCSTDSSGLINLVWLNYGIGNEVSEIPTCPSSYPQYLHFAIPLMLSHSAGNGHI